MERFRTNKQLIGHFMRGSKHLFLFAALFAAVVAFFDMITPKIIAFTVDSVIGDLPADLPAVGEKLLRGWGGLDALKAHPIRIALLVAATGALGALFRYLFRTCNARGAQKFLERTRNELFAHILELPYAWLGENNTGDIIQRCTSDVQTVRRFISEQLTTLVRTLILIAMALYFMAGIDARIALVAAAFIPIIVGYSFFFHKRIGSAFQKADEEEGKLSTIAQENLTGVRVVRAFGRELYERERFEKQNESYTGFWIHLLKLLAAFWSIGDIMSGSQTLTVVTLGAVFCVRGSMTVGAYIALVAYNLMLTWPVRSLGRTIAEMSKAGIAIDRLRYIMASEPEQDEPDAVTPPMDKDIVFDHVTYCYPNSTAVVLNDVNLTIPAGRTVGILGGTGSGKATLMYLLEKLYTLPEESGRITIGGVDIRKIRSAYLRDNIGMVLQEPFLFSRTLEENIAIAVEQEAPQVNEKRRKKTDGVEFTQKETEAEETLRAHEIRRAARIASIDEAIEGFTQGYDTMVGERGVTLSGGQKQRTAIAQMLVRHAPIMVFDDSLSAVDAETDRKIRTALRENTGDATVILIAHRITTLMHADMIYVMEKGEIRERGSHEELLAQNGLYKKIYDLQLGEEEATEHTDAAETEGPRPVPQT